MLQSKHRNRANDLDDASTMRVLVRDGDDLIETRTFGSEPVTIGSGADCSLRLAAHEVPAQHAIISPDSNGGWVIESMGGARL